jgi:hypothetical protein
MKRVATLFALAVLLLLAPACLTQSGATNQAQGSDALPAKARCFVAEPQASIPLEADSWLISVRKIDLTGKVLDPVLTTAQTDNKGFAQVCVDVQNRGDALLVSATNPALPTSLFRYVAPDSTLQVIIIDALVTQLTTLISQIHQLPFSGYIGNVTDSDFALAESKLRRLAAPPKGGSSGVSFTLTQNAWSTTLSSLHSLGAQMSCLNTPAEAGSFGLRERFTFPGAHPESFSELSESSIASDGSLYAVDGQPLPHSTLTINDVNLNEHSFDSMSKLGADLNGAHLVSHEFDIRRTLDASVTWVHLDNVSALLPCVAGIITVANNAPVRSAIEAGSSLCFGSADTQTFQNPSSQFAVINNKASSTSFVLGLPGIHSGTQSDGLGIVVSRNEVCIQFENAHELAASGEIGDLGSVLFTVCQVSEGQEENIASRIYAAGRPAFETGIHNPSLAQTPSRDELVGQIGRADFVHNPSVMRFLKADIRDSLINYNRGNAANVFLSGKGLKDNYDVYLNGVGKTIAKIETGPEGQFAGGVIVDAAKAGDFLRFKASGSFFDVMIEESCVKH